MRIGDIEYTRHTNAATAVTNSSVRTALSFALGIKVRPLLTRVQVGSADASAVTGQQGVFLENGQSVPTGLSTQGLIDDGRVHPLYLTDQALATNGMGQQVMLETMWWKILMPDIRIHWVSTLAVTRFVATLHYRFVELTDDEIIEIAAQRAQS